MERIHTTATRKLKWQAVPSTPRILHLPRRFTVRQNSPKTKTPLPSSQKDERQRLEVLFEQERSFDRRRPPPAIVVVNDAPEGRARGGGFPAAEAEAAKWRFQAEMLRAECNLLRMEKEIAVKKMERRREKMEKTLRWAVHSLLFGKQEISEGKNANKVLEQEINYLVGKLHELSKPPKIKETMEGRACRHNFDEQASVLRRRLEKLDEVSEEMCVKEIREMAEASFSVHPTPPVDHHFLPTINVNEGDNKGCSRHCQAIVRRIAEEIRAEAEQWSQMQEMLGQVREMMDELQASRDFWQDRALVSDSQIQKLRSTAQEWRKRATCSEAKAKCLEEEVRSLRGELERTRRDHSTSGIEIDRLPSETEKRVLICRLKENRHTDYDDNRSKYESIHRAGGDGGGRRRTRTETSSRSRMPLRDIRNRS
ncbi:PREDICTED: E3 ubiquitin-protein ligase bre-1 [Tarenaya hassleriana]|uniref:E3 ubiquitin-protein ligase bre-1 n=1 Tax=Tarenaya hassleriana TaxID=28532 RepID=UPI00053C0FC4|nr:PREDICTED: E3 ubiquitin-protein ligase bre-1 [Tarenaya hassleriana]